MKPEEVFTGIDVSQKLLDVCVLPLDLAFKAENHQEGIDRLIERLSDYKSALVVVEATGGLQTQVCGALCEAGYQVAVVNPRQLRDFAKAMGTLAKTDRIDAAVLALFAQKVRPEPRPLKDKQTLYLSELMTRRRQLTGMITMEKNRMGAAGKAMKRRIAANLDLLNRQLSELDDEMDDFIKGSPMWRAKEDLPKSMPGEGKVPARTLVSSLPELGGLNRKKVAALVGVAPLNRDSGTFRGRRGCWGDRAVVRNALYMTTLSSLRFNPMIKAHYLKLREKGKVFKVAMVACMRKLLVILNAMIRDNKSWKPISA